MLTSYRLILRPEGPCHLRPEMSYHLYAALLNQAPEAVGVDFHRDGVTPVSQYALPRRDGSLLWSVTVFGEENQMRLGPVLEETDLWLLDREHIILRVVERRQEAIDSVEDLLLLGERGGGLHRLRVRTPAAFKSGGRYQPLPGERMILQSLIKKWNGYFPDCPIEDADGQGMEAMAAGLQIRDFAIESRSFYLKGNQIPGFVGSLTVQDRLEGFHRTLAESLLLFSRFSGIGIKTTLGMGGVTHQFIEKS